MNKSMYRQCCFKSLPRVSFKLISVPKGYINTSNLRHIQHPDIQDLRCVSSGKPKYDQGFQMFIRS